MRVLVCGSRDWAHRTLLELVLNTLHRRDRFTVVIEGDARGADRMAGDWATAHGITLVRFPAKWDEYGKAAGPVRNQQMLDEGRPDMVIAFHEHLAASKGTADMVRRARRAGLPVLIYPVQP